MNKKNTKRCLNNLNKEDLIDLIYKNQAKIENLKYKLNKKRFKLEIITDKLFNTKVDECDECGVYDDSGIFSFCDGCKNKFCEKCQRDCGNCAVLTFCVNCIDKHEREKHENFDLKLININDYTIKYDIQVELRDTIDILRFYLEKYEKSKEINFYSNENRKNLKNHKKIRNCCYSINKEKAILYFEIIQ